MRPDALPLAPPTFDPIYLSRAARTGKRLEPRLLFLGVSVDINDNEGCTPLWLAARNGHVSCVDFLLNHRASPHHKR